VVAQPHACHIYLIYRTGRSTYCKACIWLMCHLCDSATILHDTQMRSASLCHTWCCCLLLLLLLHVCSIAKPCASLQLPSSVLLVCPFMHRLLKQLTRAWGSPSVSKTLAGLLRQTQVATKPGPQPTSSMRLPAGGRSMTDTCDPKMMLHINVDCNKGAPATLCRGARCTCDIHITAVMHC